MLGFIFGPFALILGLKGFSEAGMPFSRTRKITGTTAKFIGAICIALGVLMTVGGVYSLIQFIGGISQVSGG